MNTDNKTFLYKELTYKVIGLGYEVYNELGGGFLEKVYENAMTVLLRREQIPHRQQAATPVHFHGQVVGEYYADLITDDKIIVELKAAEELAGFHRAQVLNYLKATGFRLALLMNFGKERLDVERVIR